MVTVVDEFRVVINRGYRDGLKLGARVAIYAVSKENLVDPETREDLGKLEIVRGVGAVSHVQEKIATVRSSMRRPSPRTIVRRPWSLALGQEEEIKEEPIEVPFEDPEVGDFVRPA